LSRLGILCLLLVHTLPPLAQARDGEKEAIAGATFRMFRAPNDALVLDVLTLAVKQEHEVCGHGFGTRLVNVLKALLLSEAEAISATLPAGSAPIVCFMLTQADEGPKALNFWLKQTLSQGVAAKTALERIHNSDPKQNVWYDKAIPMICELNATT
jgi:hypothetical protein